MSLARGALLVCLLLSACSSACSSSSPPERFEFALPSGVQAPWQSADNPISHEKVELGRRLFWDRRLSADGSFACATCHQPQRAFSDGLVVARGLAGQMLPRNTPSLANVAYFSAYTWANPRLNDLEGQALVPLLATTPPELGVATMMPIVRERLQTDSDYVVRFRAAFPERAEPISTASIIAALASFERTLLSFSSPYDRYLGGDEGALSDAAKRGERLFASARVGCSSCHAGRLLTDAAPDVEARPRERPRNGEARALPRELNLRDASALPFHNVGLYDLQGRGLYPRDNPGLYEFTRRPADMGRFRTPSLRNVALTAPYMHDGSIATLDGVLDHYAAGGRTLAGGPNAGVGARNAYKDPRIRGFVLGAAERTDLLAFLTSLSDPDFGSNPRFADPFSK